MLVDDLNEMNGAKCADQITIRLTDLDVVSLLIGCVITGCNLQGKGTRVRLQKGTVNKMTEIAPGLVYGEFTNDSLRTLRSSKKICFEVHAYTVSRLTVMIDPKGQPVSGS